MMSLPSHLPHFGCFVPFQILSLSRPFLISSMVFPVLVPFPVPRPLPAFVPRSCCCLCPPPSVSPPVSLTSPRGDQFTGISRACTTKGRKGGGREGVWGTRKRWKGEKQGEGDVEVEDECWRREARGSRWRWMRNARERQDEGRGEIRGKKR